MKQFSSFCLSPSAFPRIPLLPRNCRSYESRIKPLSDETVNVQVQPFKNSTLNVELVNF